MRQSLLMCSPDYFAVKYTINPWMAGKIGTVDHTLATRQWVDFFSTLKKLTEVKLLIPQPHVPDLVFTANAGLICGNKFIPSHFRHQERRPEEPCFRDWFRSSGYEVVEWQKLLHFEGAGDALFQPGRNLLWASHGFRTDAQTHSLLAKGFAVRVLSLRLVDPRFYHLDTCFCPLLDDKVMYYPKAFDAASLKLIEEYTLPQNRIPVADEDALHFACNAVLVDRNIIMNHVSDDLGRRLEAAGYTVIIKPVSEFLKAGGANKCLTLELTKRTQIDTGATKTGKNQQIIDPRSLPADAAVAI